MNLPYARVTFSACDVVVLCTNAYCFYPKNDVSYGLSMSQLNFLGFEKLNRD